MRKHVRNFGILLIILLDDFGLYVGKEQLLDISRVNAVRPGTWDHGGERSDVATGDFGRQRSGEKYRDI